MPKVASEKRSAKSEDNEKSQKKSGWGNGQLFGSESTETTFQGAGFKDKEKAMETMRLLEGRDITFQYQIINSMYNRAKVILKRTTDKDKRKNLAEAVDTFEKWIDDYKSNNRSKENFSYLNLELLQSYLPLAKHYKIDTNFLNAFDEADGDLKKLRVTKVPGKDITWDIERNNNLKKIAGANKDNDIQLFEEDGDLKGVPTKQHTELIMWAYSAEPSKIKKCIPTIEEKLK